MENNFKEFAEQKSIVLSLRQELRSLYDKLDPLVAKRNVLYDSIGALLDKVKELRVQRDELTTVVKKFKDERSDVHKKIKEKIGDVSDLQPAQGFRNPSWYAKEIEKIEFRIQTDVMAFSKEQLLMKRIKELQKQEEQAEAAFELLNKKQMEEHQIRELKHLSKDAHGNVQKYAAESQQKHEEMLKLFEQVDAFRKEKKAYEKEIKDLRTMRDNLRQKLEGELLKLSELAKKNDIVKEERYNERKAREKSEIEHRMLSVEEKLKKGQKLTTQDLLAWQAQENE